VLSAIRRWQAELGDAYVLGLVRVAFGLLLLWNALRAVRELREGYFGDVFHWPILPETWVAPRAAYWGIVVAQLVLAVLVVTGHKARPALLASALLGIYVLLCNRLEFHHNRWALFCQSLLLAFAPCDRSLLASRAQAPARVAPLWAARLMGVQLSIIYLASGGSKLLDPDWRAGRVLLERFHMYGGSAVDAGVPQAIVEWMGSAGPASVLAKAAIATELFLALGLWMRGTRVFALWWGTWFHITIEATSRVEGFTWLTLATYAVFVTPDVRARRVLVDVARWRGRTLARCVKLLDWFARFEVRPSGSEGLEDGRALTVVGREGERATGLAGLVMIARCSPLLFPLWGPLVVVATLAKRDRSEARA
jgi:hypothetical protein